MSPVDKNGDSPVRWYDIPALLAFADAHLSDDLRGDSDLIAFIGELQENDDPDKAG